MICLWFIYGLSVVCLWFLAMRILFTLIWFVMVSFHAIPQPSNCVQKQPFLKDRVLFGLLVNHQQIEQQHQCCQAKDSSAKTSKKSSFICADLVAPSKFVRCCRAPSVFTTTFLNPTKRHRFSGKQFLLGAKFASRCWRWCIYSFISY